MGEKLVIFAALRESHRMASSSALTWNPAWKEAGGAALVKPGFSFSSEQDLLFALGWPHVRFLDPTPLDDRLAVEQCLKALDPFDAAPRLVWNARVAQGMVRAWGSPSLFEISPDEKTVRAVVLEELWNPVPLSPEEASYLLGVRLSNSLLGVSDRAMETFVLLLEALVGSFVVASALVEHLEEMPESLLASRWTLPPFITYQLGYLLLRVRPNEAEGLKKRLAAVLKKHGAADLGKARASWEDGFTHFRAIHLVLHGAEAARRGGDRNIGWYTHVHEDATFIRMRVAMDRLGYRPDARLVFLGGMDVLSSYVRRWERLDGEEQRWFVEQFGQVRSPLVAEIFLEMAVASLVRAEVVRWFVEHADFTREFLKATAEGDGLQAQQARAILADLPPGPKR